MSEQSTRKLYTTHEVAKLLGVTPITVIRWIEGKKFKCFTTVGGHRRIEHDELVRFAQSYNLPWQGEDELKQRKDFVVLAVDDEEDVLDLLQDMLCELPHVKLIKVGNAFTAGAKLVEEQPDLVLLDFRMPELDGFEFTKFVRQDPRFKDIPIVAMTGLKSDQDRARMNEVGVNDLLGKPFDSNAVMTVVNRFRSSGGQEELKKAS